MPVSLEAMILFSGNNQSNQSVGADKAAIFNIVARVCNADGSSTSGSAVRLRGKYLLTANHVTNRSHVTFDGTSYYARDLDFTPIQVSTADLKIIKLLEDPDLPDILLYENYDTEKYQNATLVAWGRGMDPANSSTGFRSSTYNWGDNSTIAKRWGTNKIALSHPPIPETNRNYNHLVTTLDPRDYNEAGLVMFDSGSGLFLNDGGTWKLAGIATAVSTAGSSTFAASYATKDINYFVQLSAYREAIEALIPELDTYEGWAIDNSLYNQNALANTDIDGDQLSQLMEFAFGTDPNLPDLGHLPESYLELEGNEMYLKFRFTRKGALPSSININVNSTEDLANWSDSSPYVSLESTQVSSDGFITEIYRRTIPISDAEMAFMRLEIELE